MHVITAVTAVTIVTAARGRNATCPTLEVPVLEVLVPKRKLHQNNNLVVYYLHVSERTNKEAT